MQTNITQELIDALVSVRAVIDRIAPAEPVVTDASHLDREELIELIDRQIKASDKFVRVCDLDMENLITHDELDIHDIQFQSEFDSDQYVTKDDLRQAVKEILGELFQSLAEEVVLK